MIRTNGLSEDDAITCWLRSSIQFWITWYNPVLLYTIMTCWFTSNPDWPCPTNKAYPHEQDTSEVANQITTSLGVLYQVFEQYVCPNLLNLYCVSKSPILSTMPNQPASSIVGCSFHWTVLLIPKMQWTQHQWNHSSLLTSSWVGLRFQRYRATLPIL